MELSWAVSCTGYQWQEDEGTVDLFGAGFDTIYVEELPTEIDLLVVVRLLLREGERGRVEVEVTDVDTQQIAAIPFVIEANPSRHHRPGYQVSQLEAFKIENVPAKTAGVYSVEIWLEGEREQPNPTRRSIQFSVVEGLPED